MNQTLGEKRAFERFDADMSIWARPVDEAGDYILLEIANISAGGLLFKLDQPLARGDRLEVRFELPQNADLVAAAAEVRHVRRDADHYLIGVAFTSVENYTVEALLAYLEALFT